MAETPTTFFIYVIFFSMIIYFLVGLIFLVIKGFSFKARKNFAIILMFMGLVNLYIFNLFIFKEFYYNIGEVVSLILFFIVPFVEGVMLLVSKEIKKKTRILFGILLILLPAIWIIMAIIGI